MTYMDTGYMTLDRQLFGRGLASALSELLAQKYRTAKHLARATGIDVSTAENLRKGHLSVTTLEKVLAREGRELWERLGEELFGESFYQWEQGRIETAIREAESARTNLVRLRAQGEELLSRAPRLDEVGAREATAPTRAGESRSWAGADRGRHQGTPRSRDRGGR